MFPAVALVAGYNASKVATIAERGRCPFSWKIPHAHTELKLIANASCDNVAEEIQARLEGSQAGHWVDPHNGGSYMLDTWNVPTTVIDAHRLTGTASISQGGPFRDDLRFTLAPPAEGYGCQVDACSVSQVISVTDFSGGYCNIFNLVCGSSLGCVPEVHDFFFAEQSIDLSWGLPGVPGASREPERCIVPVPAPTPSPAPALAPSPSPSPSPALPTADREHWAVIVAASNEYYNYRHQSDACHAYQVAKSKGIAEDHIIMMAYDDIANNAQNPFPGQIFNKPDRDGPGVDVYAGCNIDYRGDDVTPQKFMDVLTGTASGKSLQSTSEDNVFVYVVDHGAPGIIAFPGNSGVLHKAQLQSTFQTMSDKGMFNKLTMYLETCESGSMFEDMNIPNVYALSAANPTESSWGAYCGRDAVVNGKNIQTCLGDLFSVNWMEDAEAVDTTSESLDTAFNTIRSKTDKSEVLQWGDVSFTDDKVAEFVGTLNTNLKMSSATDPSASAVNNRQADLARLYSMYTSAKTSAERLVVGEQLQRELASQMAVDLIHTKFLNLVFPGKHDQQELMRSEKTLPFNMACEVFVHDAFKEHAASQFNANSGFALQFHQIVVNVCNAFMEANGGPPVNDLVNAVKVACNGVVV